MKSSDSVSAEAKFRAAFERLKSSMPRVLDAGAAVSQNNVAKEAGVDPSALRKSRYPSLVSEIQAYVEIEQRVNADNAKKVAARAQMRKRLPNTPLTIQPTQQAATDAAAGRRSDGFFASAAA